MKKNGIIVVSTGPLSTPAIRRAEHRSRQTLLPKNGFAYWSETNLPLSDICDRHKSTATKTKTTSSFFETFNGHVTEIVEEPFVLLRKWIESRFHRFPELMTNYDKHTPTHMVCLKCDPAIINRLIVSDKDVPFEQRIIVDDGEKKYSASDTTALSSMLHYQLSRLFTEEKHTFSIDGLTRIWSNSPSYCVYIIDEVGLRDEPVAQPVVRITVSNTDGLTFNMFTSSPVTE